MTENKASNLRAVSVWDFDALEPHLAAWDTLVWQAPQQVASLLPAWVEASLRHRLRPDERWMCCFAYAGERLVGVLPIIIVRHPIFGEHWQRLRTFARNNHTGDTMLAQDCAAEALQALLAEVGRQVPTHLSLDVKAVRPSSPLAVALQNGLDGYLVRPVSQMRYSFLDVRGSFDSYMKGLGGMRRNVRIGRKKLETRGRVSVEMRRGQEAQADFLPEFLALEASGWKGRMGTAILHEPEQLAFYTAVVNKFAAQGRLEWHLIRCDGRLVAAGSGLRCGSSLLLPKYAFDEDFAECMPGSLLREEILRDVFSRPEIEEVNHMSFSEADRLWHMPQDEYVNLHLIRRSAVAMLVRLPRLLARSAYQSYMRPRIPAMIWGAKRRLQRRGERLPHHIDCS